MQVRVVRPLCVGGIRKEVGEIVDLPNADEAIASGRAERISGDSSPVGPMTTETASAVVEGKEAEQDKPKKPAAKKKGEK